MVVVETLLTPVDFERMLESDALPDEDGIFYELVDGEVVRLPQAEWYHALVSGAILRAIGSFADSIGALVLGESAGYVVGERGQQVRGPDVSLVTSGRRSILEEGRRLGSGAPDLAVEVLSRKQFGEAYPRRKAPEYLSAGGKVVWLADPVRKTVRAYEAGKAEYKVYSGDAEITLDAVAPGFRASVSSFFP